MMGRIEIHVHLSFINKLTNALKVNYLQHQQKSVEADDIFLFYHEYHIIS